MIDHQFFLSMHRRPPKSTRAYTLVPYTALCRSRGGERSPKRSFASRPADPESWIKAPDRPSLRADVAAESTARLTIDVTADMRGRIKIAALDRKSTRLNSSHYCATRMPSSA